MDAGRRSGGHALSGGVLAFLVFTALVCVAAVAWCFFTTCLGPQVLGWIRHQQQRRRQASRRRGGWTPLPLDQQDAPAGA
ncbi:hypothetical protein H4R21_005769 [Coemansia helicoidea]|uniref:Uncharacterized protein n=1 Tax=Coemansia helicoidea TaxID=1286919 RepID=A0ACC1KRQ5_9FUNG|nr:hypothetical protein H4R21_005769 [Coemansia helicoidea]